MLRFLKRPLRQLIGMAAGVGVMAFSIGGSLWVAKYGPEIVATVNKIFVATIVTLAPAAVLILASAALSKGTRVVWWMAPRARIPHVRLPPVRFPKLPRPWLWDFTDQRAYVRNFLTVVLRATRVYRKHLGGPGVP